MLFFLIVFLENRDFIALRFCIYFFYVEFWVLRCLVVLGFFSFRVFGRVVEGFGVKMRR